MKVPHRSTAVEIQASFSELLELLKTTPKEERMVSIALMAASALGEIAVNLALMNDRVEAETTTGSAGAVAIKL